MLEELRRTAERGALPMKDAITDCVAYCARSATLTSQSATRAVEVS